MSLIEIVAAALLAVGSLLVIRAVYRADTLDAAPEESSQGSVPTTTQADYPKAA